MKSNNLKENVIKDYDKIVKYVIRDMHLGHKYDELYDIGLIGFVNGINNYDKSKGFKYMTFLYDCIKNEILHYLDYEKRKCRNGTTVSLNTVINNSSELQDFIPTYQDYDNELYLDEIFRIIDIRLAKLKKRDEEIFKHIYGLDGYKIMSSDELEKKFNMSRQNIQRIRARILKMLKYSIREYYKSYQEILHNKNKHDITAILYKYD